MPYIPKEQRSGSKPSAVDQARGLRAQFYREELDRLERSGKPSSALSRDEQRFRVEVANDEADRRMRSHGLAGSAELSKRAAVDSVAGGMNAYQRVATRIARNMSSTTYAAGDMLGLDKDSDRTFSGSLGRVADAARDRSTGIWEGAPSYLAGYGADPAFLALYGAGRAGLTAQIGKPKGLLGEIGRDLVAGIPADIATSAIRNNFDAGEMLTDTGYGVGGAVVGNVAMRGLALGVGKAWRTIFPDKPLPKSQAEAERILSEYDPNWMNKALDPDSVPGQNQSALRDLQDEVDNVRIVEAEKQAAKFDAGQRIQTPEPGAKKGIDRHLDRQAARDAKLQEGLDAPHIAKDKELRSPIERLEAENAGGRVLAEADVQKQVDEEIRAEALKDPDTLDEIAQLEAAGMTRLDAESIAMGHLQLNSGIPLDKMVSDAIKLGKWAKPHVVAGARWAMDSAGDAIRSMRDFSQLMMGKFGKSIRKHIPEMWQRFKELMRQGADHRARTARLRAKGGIDLRKQPASPKGRDFQRDTLTPRVKRAAGQIKRGFDYITQPVIDRVHKISPRLYNRLYQYATESNITKHEYRSILDPLMGDRAIKKLPLAKRNEIKSALLNADPEGFEAAIKGLAEGAQAKLRQMHSDARTILDDFYDEARNVGMSPGYLPDFWPRRIKSGRKGELREALNGEQRSQFDDALKTLADQKYGGNAGLVPGDEVAATLDRVLSGTGPRPTDSANPSPLKQRRVSKIPDNLLHLYEDFDVAMDGYIERMSNEIAKRRMLGGNKSLDLDNAENLAQSIGKLIADEGIVGKDADEMISIVQSLFRGGEAPLGRGTRAARSLTYVLTMGQITSTLRQVEDFSTVKAQYGLANALKGTYKSLLGQQQISLLDLGLDRIAEEYTGIGSQRVVDEVFKWTGLRAFDRKIKNAAIEASLIGAQREARRSPDALARKLSKEFGEEEAGKLVKDLADGEVSDRLLVYLTSRLGDIQPVTRLEVPQGYLDAREALGSSDMFRGSPVLAYQLRTFTARRFGLLRKEALGDMAGGVEKMMKGDKGGGSKQFFKGAGRLMSMMTTFLVAGVAVDQVIEIINGNDTGLGESAVDIALQTMGSSRYAAEQMQRSGQGGYTSMVAPPAMPTLFQFITDATRISQGKNPQLLRRLPHYKTLKLFMGDGDDGPGAPGPPPPPSPPKPPRP